MRMEVKVSPTEYHGFLIGPQGPIPIEMEIPETLSDAEILERASAIVGGHLGGAAVEVYESNGDVRVYFDSRWHYHTAVSEEALRQMAADR